MDKDNNIEARKYNLITQITSFENEILLQKIEDFFYLIKQQSKFDPSYNQHDNEGQNNLFIEQLF